jgi:hypothetical protein
MYRLYSNSVYRTRHLAEDGGSERPTTAAAAAPRGAIFSKLKG